MISRFGKRFPRFGERIRIGYAYVSVGCSKVRNSSWFLYPIEPKGSHGNRANDDSEKLVGSYRMVRADPLFLVFGRDYLHTSPDGAAWTRREPIPASFYPVAAAATDSLLVAVGQSGSVLTSPDGTVWTPRASGLTDRFACMIRAGDRLVAFSDSGYVAVTRDGVHWSVSNSKLKTWSDWGTVGAAVWTGTRFIAVGYPGVIMTSESDVPLGLSPHRGAARQSSRSRGAARGGYGSQVLYTAPNLSPAESGSPVPLFNAVGRKKGQP